jgi:phosphatidylethanolamine-binding protein (PEBP) family uncharacterized protein
MQRLEHDLDLSRREANGIRMENTQLRSELAALQNTAAGSTYHGPAPAATHPHAYGVQSEQLPPLRSLSGPESMNGVQYQHDQRPNGFRTAERF